jgi:Gpi18-like mannosyltransferase
LRRSLRDHITSDYKAFSNWYDFIVNNGGFNALKYNFSDYTPPYLYLIVIASKIYSNLPRVVAIKLITIPFDFICAFFVYKIVRLHYPKNKLPIIAFLTLLFAPTIFINSSYWGQVDMIYTSLLIACLYFIAIGSKVTAFICFGIAFAFKQQAIFMFPFLIMLGAKGIVSWWFFLIIPATYLITMVPAWIAGRPIKDIFVIYFNQSQTFQSLTLNSPNLYQWFPAEFYNWLFPLGLIATVIIVAVIIFWIYKSNFIMTVPLLIQLALLSVLVMPYFLPKMHERYFFPADVISIIYGFYFPDYFFVPVAINLISLFSYFPFLLGSQIGSFKILSIILGAIILLVFKHLHQTIQIQKSSFIER